MFARMDSRIHAVLAAALATVALAAAPATAHAQVNPPVECPDTFEVLHDDTVGALDLVQGSYTITLLGSTPPSCARATDLFRQFLEDWDGKLPRPWRVDARASSFTRGGGPNGFKVTRAGPNDHGQRPTGEACPGTFRVLHNDNIGTFVILKGNYRITLLGAGRLTCARAASYLARFLDDFDGVLPFPWFLDRETASFVRGTRNVGFRIKELAGPPQPSGGGSGTYPNGNRCPGTFRVLHDDRIGRLRLAAGPYRITLRGGLSCKRASALFEHFLDDFAGTLPPPWRLNVQRGTFTRGSGSGTGFRVKPARG
jgi:hypothetical protein